VAPLYTAHVSVRHHELDAFGRLHPGVYLRWLAEAAIEASTALGYDSAWYRAAGGLWIVRRSTLDVLQAIRGGERLTVRTWVEDFRRVRSERRYELWGADGALRVEARTDWVFVDAASLRPRRVPPDLERAFAARAVNPSPRTTWQAPPAPTAPARTVHRVGAHELDGLAHVNNAVYLDLLAQAVLDALGDAGWSLDRLVASGGVPVFARADLEYLEAARYGDRLEVRTWFSPLAGALDAHQVIAREGEAPDGDARALVRATTRWRWTAADRADPAGLPDGLLTALEPVLAA
jgi:acyl-CoA thioester hydrolase